MKKLVTTLLVAMLLLSTIGASAEIPINFWTVFNGDDGIIMQNLVDQFNAENTDGIVVTHLPMSADDFYTKLPLAVQTGEDIPDIMIAHIERVAKLAADGIITDMDFTIECGIDLSSLPAESVARGNIDGCQYTVPWDYNMICTYANVDLLAKYNVMHIVDDGFITFDEVKEIGAAIEAAGDKDNCYALYYCGSGNEFLPRYEELGGKLFDENGNISIDTEIWAQMIRDLREFNELGYALPQGMSGKTNYIGQKIVLYQSGIWSSVTFRQAEGLHYEMYPLVCYSPETALSRVSSHNWMQADNENRTEETDRAVAKFVEWMGQHALVWGTDAGQLPLHKSATESEEFKNLPQAFLASEEMKDHIRAYNFYHWALLNNALNRLGKDPMYDLTMDPVAIGEAVQKEVNDAIAASK